MANNIGKLAVLLTAEATPLLNTFGTIAPAAQQTMAKTQAALAKPLNVPAPTFTPAQQRAFHSLPPAWVMGTNPAQKAVISAAKQSQTTSSLLTGNGLDKALGGMLGGGLGGLAKGLFAVPVIGAIAWGASQIVGIFMGMFDTVLGMSLKFVQHSNPGTVERFSRTMNDLYAVIGLRLNPVLNLMIGGVRWFANVLHAVLPSQAQMNRLTAHLGAIFEKLGSTLEAMIPTIKWLIDKAEWLINHFPGGDKGAGMALSGGVGALVGQVAIPIPGLGAAIGAGVGLFLDKIFPPDKLPDTTDMGNKAPQFVGLEDLQKHALASAMLAGRETPAQEMARKQEEANQLLKQIVKNTLRDAGINRGILG